MLLPSVGNGKLSWGQTSQHFRFCLESKDSVSSGLKSRRTICFVSVHSSKASVHGCISAHGIMGNMHICKGTINAERYISVLEQHSHIPIFSMYPIEVEERKGERWKKGRGSSRKTEKQRGQRGLHHVQSSSVYIYCDISKWSLM